MTAASNPLLEFPRPHPSRIATAVGTSARRPTAIREAVVLEFPPHHHREANEWALRLSRFGDIVQLDAGDWKVVVVTHRNVMAALTVAADRSLDLFVDEGVTSPKLTPENWLDVRARLVLSPLTQDTLAFAKQIAASNPELVERLIRRAGKVEATMKVVEKALKLPVLDQDATDTALYDEEGLPR